VSLTIITKPVVTRHFLTYDFEWIPGEPIHEGITKPLQIRVCGCYDGESYRSYSTVRAFLQSELTHKNRGAWFFGHAGGLADLGFILAEIKSLMCEQGFRVKASFSGSSAIIVHVTRGKHTWHFIDSYWLLRDKLENIAKWIGLEKGAAEKRRTREESIAFYGGAPIAELTTYNEQDCVILWKAIDEFENALLDFGGQLQMTLASSAMHLFRRHFLSRNIETSDYANDIGRQAYFASRVEVFCQDATDCNYYDINSSFPYAMTFPAPGEVLGTKRTLPNSEDAIFLADCLIEVRDCFLPPIPHRAHGRVFFPVGRWRTWLSSIDVRLLERTGGRIEKVYECIGFAPFHDLADYAKTLYTKRKNATTDMEKVVYKLLLNSLYGKFAESPDKQAVLFNPPEMPKEATMYCPGVWLQDVQVPIPHAHVPVSTHITAIARQSIFDWLAVCEPDFYYCDTDGFATTANLDTGKELGELKLEKVLTDARFQAPKVYRFTTAEGKEVVKAKGFSDMSREKFDRLIDGEFVEFQRMARIKELYGRLHSPDPVEVLIKKCLKGISLTKRFTYPDGTTRPWSIDELYSGKLFVPFDEGLSEPDWLDL